MFSSTRALAFRALQNGVVVRSSFAHTIDSCLARQYSSSPPDLMMDSLKTWLQKIGKKTTLGASTALYTICDTHSSHAYWQKHAKVGDDFRSKHMLLVLHIWLVHKRLIVEGKRGQNVQESLFDHLWDSTTTKMHKMGIPEISLNKYLKEVQNYSFRTCIDLDHALDQLKLPLTELNAKKLKDLQGLEPGKAPEEYSVQLFKNTEEAVIDSIAAAVWRGIYLRKEDVDEELVISVARYVRSEQDRLMSLPVEDLFEGKFTFQSVVPFLNIPQSGIRVGSASSVTGKK